MSEITNFVDIFMSYCYFEKTLRGHKLKFLDAIYIGEILEKLVLLWKSTTNDSVEFIYCNSVNLILVVLSMTKDT